MSRRWRFGDGSGRDPGAPWADALLEPLRALQIDCEITPTLMTRLAAEQPRRGRSATLRRPGLLLAICATGGLAALATALAALSATLGAGGEEARQLHALLGSFGRTAVLLAQGLGTIAGGLAAMALPLLCGWWIVMETATPLLQGAGLIASALGGLTILVSLYLFAHAHAAAPVATGRGGFRFMGGTR
jgi:hypothetical protein